jgi:hypothetical protein
VFLKVKVIPAALPIKTMLVETINRRNR